MATSAEELEAMVARMGDNASFADVERLLNGGEVEGGGEAKGASAQAEQTQGTADTSTASTESTQQSDDSTKTQTEQTAQAASTENANAREQAVSPGTEAGEVAGVLGPDGKSVIPYGVLVGARRNLANASKQLETERQARERAEREAADLRRQLEEGRQATSKDVKQVQAQADAAGIAGDVTKIDLVKLREEYDGPIVDVIAALQDSLLTSNRKIAELEGKTQEFDNRERQVRQTTIQQDIDSVPALADWQANKPEQWKDAVALDQTLSKTSAWADKPRIERFRHVAKMLGASDDQLGVQTSQQTQQQQAASSQQAKPPAATGTKAKVDAALAQASRAVPTSHSDLPAGTAAAQSELESLENMSVEQIGAKFATMRPEKLEELLSRIG